VRRIDNKEIAKLTTAANRSLLRKEVMSLSVGAPSPLAFDAPKNDNPIRPIPKLLRRSSKKRNNAFLTVIGD
jgi:hypothetical protein